MNFTLGVDLAQARDHTALALIQHGEALGDWNSATLQCARFEVYDLRLLERLPLGTSYMDVTARIRRITAHPELRGRITVVVDATGVGAPVLEMLRQAGISSMIVPVIITGGETAIDAGLQQRVPKKDLVAVVTRLLEEQKLRIADELAARDLLLEELMNFRAKPSRRNIRYEAGSPREHDDLVLALALACWWARPRPEYGEKSDGRLV
jgi:hypothetical protein